MTGRPAAPTPRPRFAHALRLLAVPIIVGWVALTVVVNVAVPQLEVISEEHSAPLAPMDAPSMVAMTRLGHNFDEYHSNSTVMLVLEGDDELGAEAHRYYDALIDTIPGTSNTSRTSGATGSPRPGCKAPMVTPPMCC